MIDTDISNSAESGGEELNLSVPRWGLELGARLELRLVIVLEAASYPRRAGVTSLQHNGSMAICTCAQVIVIASELAVNSTRPQFAVCRQCPNSYPQCDQAVVCLRHRHDRHLQTQPSYHTHSTLLVSLDWPGTSDHPTKHTKHLDHVLDTGRTKCCCARGIGSADPSSQRLQAFSDSGGHPQYTMPSALASEHSLSVIRPAEACSSNSPQDMPKSGIATLTNSDDTEAPSEHTELQALLAAGDELLSKWAFLEGSC